MKTPKQPTKTSLRLCASVAKKTVPQPQRAQPPRPSRPPTTQASVLSVPSVVKISLCLCASVAKKTVPQPQRAQPPRPSRPPNTQASVLSVSSVVKISLCLSKCKQVMQILQVIPTSTSRHPSPLLWGGAGGGVEFRALCASVVNPKPSNTAPSSPPNPQKTGETWGLSRASPGDARCAKGALLHSHSRQYWKLEQRALYSSPSMIR